MPNANFFEVSLEQSRIKADIVSNYFWVWANIMKSTMTRTGRKDRLAYIDLFAGPGRYKDQTASTPIMVIEKALKDPDMCQMLVTMFNDGDANNTASLKEAIEQIPGIEKLKHEPIIYNDQVGENAIKMFENMSLVPTLFFVDPWGYKGLSLRLINSVLRNWGCDCIFFFNFNRINMGLSNDRVKQHMDALFGEERAEQLRSKIKDANPLDRELTVVDEIGQALKEMGGRFVLPFRFRNDRGTKTSHYLIFVSKHFKGYEVMKGVMAKGSSEIIDGVPSLEYNPATKRHPFLFQFARPLEDLKDLLTHHFKGKQLSMKAIYEEHSVNTPYLEKNYKDVLQQLETEGRIIVTRPSGKKRIKNSFPPDLLVTFP